MRQPCRHIVSWADRSSGASRGRIRAYTMGLWLNQSVFCVLLEVADRDIVGRARSCFVNSVAKRTPKAHVGSIRWMIPAFRVWRKPSAGIILPDCCRIML